MPQSAFPRHHKQRLIRMPRNSRRPLCPLPPKGISIGVQRKAHGAEFAQLPPAAVPDVDCRTLGVRAGHQRKPRMASQLFKRAFAANQPTCHYFKISHPSTVVVAGLRGEALTGMRSHSSVNHRNVSFGPASSIAHSPTEAPSLTGCR
ncbi:hypothetical protein GCM10010236_80620 [Streptomyces eurythermus]|nr:hypothetical protein GCM10010236_80620 [Streptomyces eurythermus]